MKHGREQLADWLKRMGMKQGDFARIIGIPESELSKILNGRRTPGSAGLLLALTIEDHTGVPVRSWAPKAFGKRPKAKRSKTLQSQVSSEESCAIPS